MKAAQYNSYGGPEVIEIHSDAPKPTLKEGQVLVEVHAASLNPFDYKVRRGYMKDAIPLHFPVTIGGDFSGVITEVSDTVNDFSVGDEVYGQATNIGDNSGSLAEFASVKTKGIALKPKNLRYTEAASLVLVGASAIQALEESIHLQRGQKILIHGGAGGIGSISIQLAKYLGAYVVTTVGTDDIDFVKSLGADEVINYKEQEFEKIVKDVDSVFDTVGGATVEKSFTIVKKGGVVVSMVGPVDEKKAEEIGINAKYQSTNVTNDRLTKLTQLIEKDVIKPQIDKVFSLDEAAEAYRYLETSHPKGKVVIKIQ